MIVHVLATVFVRSCNSVRFTRGCHRHSRHGSCQLQGL